MKMQFKKGNDLTQEDQKYVLAAYVHRYTREHRPAWVDEFPSKNGVHFASDKEWLERTDFHVRKNGRLDMRHKNCFSHPTWPDMK